MRQVRLIDEQPTQQDVHVAALRDFYEPEDGAHEDGDDGLPFGADPFDILAHKQEGELS